MPEIGTSGLMSGGGKRSGASASVLAPVLDSTTPAGVRGAGLRSCCVESRLDILAGAERRARQEDPRRLSALQA